MTTYDAIIVGAGFCGLSAGEALLAAGLDVLVLEARDRVGGRVEARLNGLGERVDTGGQFFCEDMPQITALARRFGKTFVETEVEGRVLVRPPPSPGYDWGRSAAIRERMRALDPCDPTLAGLSAAAWLAAQPDREDAKAGFRSSIQGLWCRALEDIPLAYLVSNDRRITNETWELQYHLAGTMHGLAEALAASLGSAVRTGMPVARVEHGPDGVTVTANGQRIQARNLLVAVPPGRAGRIAFSPALPNPVAAALDAWASGGVFKALIRYEMAFWREKGLSGMVIWHDPAGLFLCEISRDPGHPELVLFAGGPVADAWRRLGEAVRGEAVRRLVDGLGPDAADFLDLTLREWTDDPWSGGGYGDLLKLGASLDAEDTLRQGFGPVRFASSELSSSFPCYVEGAIVAGREGARRILDFLQVAK